MVTLLRAINWLKDPAESRQFGHDWDDAIDDPITSSTWDVEDGVTDTSPNIDNGHVPPRTSLWLDGGEAGGGADARGYEIKNTVVTTSGQILVRRAYLMVEER